MKIRNCPNSRSSRFQSIFKCHFFLKRSFFVSKKSVRKLLASLFLIVSPAAFTQITVKPKDSTDLTFTGTRINPYSIEYDSTGKILVSAYVDTYYGYYSDQETTAGYVKFPTISPRSGQFGLNIAQVSAKYQSARFRGVGTVFFGDVANSAWSPKYNMIQEANAGFRIAGKFWLDAGFFRTHIGLESIQPRENIAISLATTTYFEPYYLSGAKLSYEPSDKWTFQVNAFNGFNNFVDNNANKMFGVSVAHNPTKNFNITLSSVVCDESPDGFPQAQTRSYTNLISIFRSNRTTIGFEVNYGLQSHTKLSDSTQTAQMFSTLLAGKYRFTTKWAGYGRVEYFSDPDEMLTGPVENELHQLIGLDIFGITAGVEFKPIPNSYVRLEGRLLNTEPGEMIFLQNGSYTSQRYEVLFGMGLWF